MAARFLLAPAESDPDHPTVSRWAHGLSYLLVLAILALGMTFVLQGLRYRWNWAGAWQYRALIWQGWVTTVGLALGSLLASTGLGVAAALASRCRVLPLRALVRVYVELVRGTPLLVQVLVLFYVVAPPFHVENRLVVGVVALSLFAGAYITEIVRAGLASVGKSQWTTARALGLTRAQTYRWVVFPQAWRHVLPPLAGQCASLIKDSSLLSVIGIHELTLGAQQVNSITYSSLESYFPLALGYLVLTLPISLWSRSLERRARFDT